MLKKLIFFLKVKIVKPILNGILFYLPLNRHLILLESNYEFQDNTKALFLKMVEKKIDRKYKIIWIVKSESIKMMIENDYPNVKAVNIQKNIGMLKKKYFESIAAYTFYTHQLLGHIKKSNQKRIFLTHGTPFKDSTGCFWEGDLNTQIVTTSHFAGELRTTTFFGKGMDRLLITGFPRNDELFSEKINIKKSFSLDQEIKKVIVWLPTFKRLNGENRNDFSIDKNSDMSILEGENISLINEYLKNKSTQLIIKFHPNQDLKYVNFSSLSNITVLTNKELLNLNIDLYNLLGSADALITDFSSVFIDYLLMEKPLAFDFSDIDDYKNGRGFLVEDPENYMPGLKIKNITDMFLFVDSLYMENDVFKADRIKMMNIFHEYNDGQSAERLIDKLELDYE